MNKNWWEYEITAECSWYWRKIVAVKNAFKEKMDLTSFVNTKYSIKQGYKMLFEQQQVMKVEWCSIVWERLSIPKHRVIMWLVLLGRIGTKDKLWNLGIVSDQLCMQLKVFSIYFLSVGIALVVYRKFSSGLAGKVLQKRWKDCSSGLEKQEKVLSKRESYMLFCLL